MNILKAYELVPEAYRQKFRNSKKTEKQTYVEFGREKEMLFDRWCLAKEINQDYTQLRQLMLIEEFKNCLPTDIKTYVDEQKAGNLHQAATLADDYALTHKSLFGRVLQGSRESQWSTGDPRPLTSQALGPRDQNERRLPRAPTGPTCYYCKKKGHVLSECRALEKKNLKPANPLLVATKVTTANNTEPPDRGQSQNSENTQIQGCAPFISHGTVCFNGKEKVSIKILRDTGATQSLMLGVLPFSQESSTGISVLLQGVELGVVRVPLHAVHLESDLVSGPIAVGLRPSLPVKGISLILGNHLAGDKIVVNPQVSETPSKEVKWELDS